MVKNFFKKIKEEFLNDLFPFGISCLNCGEELNNDDLLCKKCKGKFIFIKKRCKKCGNPVNDYTEICDDCLNKSRSFDLALSPLEYGGTAQHLIYKLKYDEEKFVGKVFSKMLVDCFLFANLKVDLVTVVPLNIKRKKKRRYNQAEVICDEFLLELSKRGINLEKNYNLIIREKNTPSQTLLTKDERQENLKGAFKLNCKRKDIKGKNILIVDDIFTTGATMEELSKVLKDAKAEKVYCLTVCHTNVGRNKDK